MQRANYQNHILMTEGLNLKKCSTYENAYIKNKSTEYNHNLYFCNSTAKAAGFVPGQTDAKIYKMILGYILVTACSKQKSIFSVIKQH